MNSKVKKMLVNAAMAGMIAGAGVMVPAAGAATTTTGVSQNGAPRVQGHERVQRAGQLQVG